VLLLLRNRVFSNKIERHAKSGTLRTTPRLPKMRLRYVPTTQHNARQHRRMLHSSCPLLLSEQHDQCGKASFISTHPFCSLVLTVPVASSLQSSQKDKAIKTGGTSGIAVYFLGSLHSRLARRLIHLQLRCQTLVDASNANSATV